MKGRQIVIGPLFGKEAAALLVDGQLEDLIIDPSEITPLAPGTICRGRVDRLIKGQGGVFLRLPEGETGYLRDRNGLREGQALLVQVTGAAEDGKAIPLTTRVLFRGRNVIVTLNAPGVNVSRRIKDPEIRDGLTQLGERALDGVDDAPGLIFRSTAAQSTLDEIEDELQQLLGMALAVAQDTGTAPELLLDAPTPGEVAWIDWNEPEPDDILEGDTAFEESGALDALEAVLSPRTELGSGAWASIEATRALVAIDVNTGQDHSPAAGLKANIALARDLPRQLRLRGIGGQIVVDFAPMPKRDRGTLEQVLRAAFKAESSETVLIGWTAMGLYEINRKRDRVPLIMLAGDA